MTGLLCLYLPHTVHIELTFEEHHGSCGNANDQNKVY